MCQRRGARVAIKTDKVRAWRISRKIRLHSCCVSYHSSWRQLTVDMSHPWCRILIKSVDSPQIIRGRQGGISSLTRQMNGQKMKSVVISCCDHWTESLSVMIRAEIDQTRVNKSIRRSRRVWDSHLRLLKLRESVSSLMSHVCKICQWHRSSVEDMQASPSIRPDPSIVRVASDLGRSRWCRRTRCVLWEKLSCDICLDSKLWVRTAVSRCRRRITDLLVYLLSVTRGRKRSIPVNYKGWQLKDVRYHQYVWIWWRPASFASITAMSVESDI